MYVNFEAGNKAYKLRLNTRSIVNLEKSLGNVNPVNIFLDMEQQQALAPVSVMVAVLHAALQQYHHGISLNDAYEIFDAYIEDGNSVDAFIYVILDIYRESGLIPKEEEQEKN